MSIENIVGNVTKQVGKVLENALYYTKASLLGPVAAIVMACPSASIPFDTAKKYNLSCCEILDCSGYDGCSEEGTAMKSGVLVNNCSCYNNPSTSSSSSSDYEKPSIDKPSIPKTHCEKPIRN